MIIDFIIEDLMLNSYLQKNFHTLVFNFDMFQRPQWLIDKLQQQLRLILLYL